VTDDGPLLTGRLQLVPLSVTDGAEMVGVLTEPGLYRFTGGTPPSLAELERRYRAQVAGRSPDGSETWRNWIVRLRDGGAAVGFVQATLTDAGRAADVAWVIGAPWQGQGYATEAARAMVTHLVLGGVETVTAHVHPDHAASGRVAAAIGLLLTGDVENGECVWRLNPRPAGASSGGARAARRRG
jgi:RimJ/RimL family protein N-acetyltransferase